MSTTPFLPSPSNKETSSHYNPLSPIISKMFTLFPYLPPSIRHKIYTLSLLSSSPRLVAVNTTTISTHFLPSTFPSPIPRLPLYSHACIPPLLHTCRESRLHTHSLGRTLTFSNAAPQTYFNYNIDILYLEQNASTLTRPRFTMYNQQRFSPLNIKQVRFLALAQTVRS